MQQLVLFGSRCIDFQFKTAMYLIGLQTKEIQIVSLILDRIVCDNHVFDSIFSRIIPSSDKFSLQVKLKLSLKSQKLNNRLVAFSLLSPLTKQFIQTLLRYFRVTSQAKNERAYHELAPRTFTKDTTPSCEVDDVGCPPSYKIIAIRLENRSASPILSIFRR